MVVGGSLRSRSQAEYGVAMIELVATALAVNIDAYTHDAIGTGFLSLIQALLTRGGNALYI